MLYYFLWLIIIIDLIIYAYLTELNNSRQGIKFAFIMYVYGLVTPFWIILSKISKDLVFDSVFYDIIGTITYTIALIYFAGTFKEILSTNKLIGLVFCIIGIGIFKIK